MSRNPASAELSARSPQSAHRAPDRPRNRKKPLSVETMSPGCSVSSPSTRWVAIFSGGSGATKRRGH